VALQDDGFHEIQLNGKQLVFLFMAATVVSVVIFLCGVLVGRGVRAERNVAEEAPANPVADGPTDRAPERAARLPAPAPAGSDPTTAAPPTPPTEDLTYFDRLEKPKPPEEQLKAPVSEKADKGPNQRQARKTASASDSADRSANDNRDRKSQASPPATPAPPAAQPAEPAGQGYAVQIAALNVRTEAEAIAKRLTSKGYSAYVLTPPQGTPLVYRVRVGKFPTRREAESMAARLKKEELFNPWITR
jgi:cell division septation protein DedD